MMFHHISLVNITAAHVNDKRFSERFQTLQDQLSTPGRIEHTCLHEAGHLVYLREAKIPAFKYGPTIEYLNDEFISCLAAIGTPTIDEFTTRYTPELLTDLALAGIAANLFGDEFLKELDSDSPLAKTLRNERQIVYDNDFDTFKRRCKWALRNGVSYDPGGYWRKAEESVTKELPDQRMRNEIRLAAEEIRKECFREIALIA
jgi:hypothetical protein